VLGYSRQDVDRQPVRLRESHRYEVDPALHQVRHEGDLAGEPIQFGDDQDGAV
jgi:hypothetical protein